RANAGVSLDAASTFRVEIFGDQLGTQYDQLDVDGAVALNGATLDVILSGTSVGDTFRIIRNDGLFDPVGGTFNGLPEGATLTASNGALLQISYHGVFNPIGDLGRNDVVLKQVDTGTMAQDLALTPAVIDEGESVVLTGRLIDPDAGDKLTLVVDWDDGSRPETFHPGRDAFRLAHRYRDDGAYTVHVTWFDEHGQGNGGDLGVTVNNVPPRVFAGGPASVAPGGVLVRAGSFADPGRDAWTATVDYGEGSGPQPLALHGNTF